MKDKMTLEEATIKSLYNQLDDTKEYDDVNGIVDDVLVITDPEISSDEYDEVIERAQELVEDTPEGEIPLDDEYLGQYVLTCPNCGNTFVEDNLLEPGAACPICLEVPEAFIVKGKLESEDDVLEDFKEPEDKEETEAPIPVEDSEEVTNEEVTEEPEENREELEASEQVKTASNKLQENTKLNENKKITEDYSNGIVYTIKLNTSTAAFEDYGEGEVDKVLEKLASKIKDGDVEGKVLDSNGNECLTFTSEEEIIKENKEVKIESMEEKGWDRDDIDYMLEYGTIPMNASYIGGLKECVAEEIYEVNAEDDPLLTETEMDKISDIVSKCNSRFCEVDFPTGQTADDCKVEVYACNGFGKDKKLVGTVDVQSILNLYKKESKELKAESISENEIVQLHQTIEDAEDMDEIQDAIYSISDGILEDEVQRAFDQCVQDEDDLDVVKGFVLSTLEDNAEYED